MSKFTLYDWLCQSCDLKFEQLEKPDVYTTECPDCTGHAKRLISSPRLDPKMGLDPSNPSAYERWARVNKQKTEQDKKFFEKHGVDKKHHSYGS